MSIKRNDFSHISALWLADNEAINEGRNNWIAFISKNNEVTVVGGATIPPLVTVPIASAPDKDSLYANETVTSEDNRIKALDASDTNTNNETLIIHYLG